MKSSKSIITQNIIPGNLAKRLLGLDKVRSVKFDPAMSLDLGATISLANNPSVSKINRRIQLVIKACIVAHVRSEYTPGRTMEIKSNNFAEEYSYLVRLRDTQCNFNHNLEGVVA